jgi:hypothetical protein
LLNLLSAGLSSRKYVSLGSQNCSRSIQKGRQRFILSSCLSCQLLNIRLGLSNADIAERINLDFGGDLRCIFSSDNAEKPVLQIRMTNEDDSTRPEDGLDEEDLFLKKIEQNLLNQMHLRGIDGCCLFYVSSIV